MDALVKKARQMLYFLRQLRKFGLRREILIQFYRSTIESVLTFSISVWYGGLNQRQRNKMDRVVRTASKIVGAELPSLAAIYVQRVKARARKITADCSHPACSLFQMLPSGGRYRVVRARTNRLRNSFFPKAVTILSGP